MNISPDLLRRQPMPGPKVTPLPEGKNEVPRMGNPPPQRRTSWTAADLLSADFPEPKWAVPGLLPVGLALLAGRPKQGKSFLGLQLSLATGTGGRFLGREIEQGRVVYLALEDTPRRIQRRLCDMGAPASRGVRFEFAWAALNGKGLADLRKLFEVDGPTLIVVDTLSRAMGGRVDWDNLAAVTGLMGGLQSLALEHDCCILLIDHHRKGNGFDSDLVDDVMGSTAKAAVCDTIMGLYRKRGEHGATLKVVGRDVEEAALTIRFDQLTRCWQLDDVTVQGVQAEILDALETLESATVTELASYLDKDKGNLSRELAELVYKGLIRKRSDSRTAPYVLC